MLSEAEANLESCSVRNSIEVPWTQEVNLSISYRKSFHLWGECWEMSLGGRGSRTLELAGGGWDCKLNQSEVRNLRDDGTECWGKIHKHDPCTSPGAGERPVGLIPLMWDNSSLSNVVLTTDVSVTGLQVFSSGMGAFFGTGMIVECLQL